MFVHKSVKFSIYFGNHQNAVSCNEIEQQQKTQSIVYVANQLGAGQIAFLQQNHGIDGLYVFEDDNVDYIFNHSGDYIITKRTSCGIGVVTADCLPIVLYDTEHHVVSIIHAGWKGLAAGIFQKVLHTMIDETKTKPENVEIYLGPAAGACCYEVQQDFVHKFADYQANFDIFFMTKDGKTYFDNRLFVTVLARSLGIRQEKIYTRYNVCTICDLSFCSYRREKDKAHRQISMVCLH